MILDYCFLGKQSKAAAYYARARHNNCDTLYISTYFNISIEITVHIYPLRNSKSSVKQYGTENNFITIDFTSNRCNGKYRKNLDTFYLPKDFKDQDWSLYYQSIPHRRHSSMTFIDIKNPQERYKIIKAYIETVLQIKYKRLDDKAEGLQRKRQIEEVYHMMWLNKRIVSNFIFHYMQVFISL